MLELVFLPIKFPGLNEYTAANRNNRYGGGAMKKKYTDEVAKLVGHLPKFKNPVWIHFHWIEKDKRRDPDNIIFAKKFILDGLVKAGVIWNDTQMFIQGFEDSWEVDKSKIGVQVTIIEDKS